MPKRPSGAPAVKGSVTAWPDDQAVIALAAGQPSCLPFIDDLTDAERLLALAARPTRPGDLAAAVQGHEVLALLIREGALPPCSEQAATTSTRPSGPAGQAEYRPSATAAAGAQATTNGRCAAAGRFGLPGQVGHRP